MAHTRRRRHHRRFHRNPGFSLGSVTGNLAQNFKKALVGAGGIVAVGLATDAIGSATNLTDPKTKSLIGLAVALFGLPLAGKLTKVGLFADAAPAASSVALLKAVQQYIPGIPGVSGVAGVGDQYLLRRDMEAPRALLGSTVPFPIAG